MMTSNQMRRLLGIGTLLAAILAAPAIQAHKATERYIPIGQSPGISHNFTVVGKIEAVDPQRRSVTVATPSGTVTVVVRGEANIWVDRSRLKQTNLNGDFTDLQSGRTVEVKFQNAERRQIVDWVKVEAPALP